MSFEKYKKNSFCIRGRHRSGTVKIYGDITSKRNKVIIGSKCRRKKSMSVGDYTIQAEGLGDLLRNVGKKDSMYQKRWQKTY